MMNHHQQHNANQNSTSDPRRRHNLVVLGGGRGLTLTPQQPMQQQQQQRPPVQVQRQTFWTCDICQVAKFKDYNEACRHEALCQSIQDNLKKAAALEKRAKQQQQQQRQQQQQYRQSLPSLVQQAPIAVKPNSPPRLQQASPRQQQQQASPSRQNEASPYKKSKIWTCDVCLVAQFDTYKEASKHEQNCKPKKKKPNIVWNCDVCKIAQFDTFEEAQAHESLCKKEEEKKTPQQPQQQQKITWTCDVCKIAEFEDFDDACRHEAQCGKMKFDDEMDVVPLEQKIEEIANRTSPILKKKKRKKNIHIPVFDHVLLLAGKTKSNREQKSRAAKDGKKTYDEGFSSDESFSSNNSSFMEHEYEERESDGPILDMSIMTSLKDYIGGRKCVSTDSESDAPSIIPPELILPTTSLKENYQEWFYESESESDASSVQKLHRRPMNRTNPTNVKEEKQSIWV